MKKAILLLTYLIIFSFLAQAQNSIWSLPPNYLINHQIQSLPTQPGTNPSLPFTTMQLDNYHGQDATFMHNAMQDANGDLLFFIVDSRIYDDEGYIMGVLNDGGVSSGSFLDEIVGYSEIMIIPVPGNCQQYYLVTGNSAGLSSHGEMSIYYALLDLSVTSLETGRKGVLLTPDVVNNVFLNVEAPFLTNTTISLSSQAPNFTSTGEHEANTSMAITQLRSDNTRLLFFNGPISLYRFKITSVGISYDGYSFLLDGTNNIPYISDIATRSEMEIISTPTGYRLAFAYPSQVSSTPVIRASTLLVADLNSNGSIVSTTLDTKNLLNDANVRADIKGLEFSPNGDYLYITHDINNNNPDGFKIYDVAAQNFISNTVINNPQLFTDMSSLGFKNSYIELASDSMLYFANANGLATINNPNNPTSGVNWNNSAQTVNYNLNTLGFTNAVERLKVYILPDQIDGMDYAAYLVDPAVAGIECCRENTSYDISKDDNNNEFDTTVVWDGATSNNPWSANSTTGVTVKDQMIIKSGANITINNMRFEFAPEAQLIIEDGARLTINGTTLTADTRCDSNAMWHGVEVWGGSNPFQPIDAGRFLAQNNSVIEHAMEATANYQHDLTGGSPVTNVAVAGFNGGIIQLNTSTLRNNVYDVYMITYQSVSPSGGNIGDQSHFVNCNFVTDAALNNPNINPAQHAHLYYVDNIRFTGCDFQNTTTGIFIAPQRGMGIVAEETRLTVTSRCNTISFPCTSLDSSHFNNLFIGINAKSNNPAKTATITNNAFDDVWRCVILRGLDYATVSNNDMNIGASFGPKSVGLGMVNCDQYKVTYNAFHTSYNAHAGCYVENSGTAANEIYKNTFTDLVVGSQAAKTNGDHLALTGATGLEFRCNEYYNTNDYDILVSSGEIKAFHGSCLVNTAPSNNQFSYTAQLGDIWLSSNVTSNVSYQYSTGGINLPPITYPSAPPSVNPTSCPNLPAFNKATDCPVRTTFSILQLKQLIAANKQIVTDLQSQIDGGDTQALLNNIATMPAWQVNNELSAASPYLSEEVLLAVLDVNNNLPNWVIVNALTDNAPLSDAVLLAAINRTTALPTYVIKNLATLSSPLSTNEQLALVNHTPKYANWMLEQIMVNESPLQEAVLLALLAKTPSIAGWSISNILKKNTPLTEAVNFEFNNHSPMYPNWIRNGVNNNYFVADAPIEEAQPLSPRMELDQEIAYYKTVTKRYKRDLIQQLLAGDGTPDETNYKNLAAFLSEDIANNTNSDNQALVNAQIADGDLSAAQQQLSNIHNTKNADFCKLKNTVIACQQYPEKEAVLLTNSGLRQNVDEVATATTNQLEVTSAQVLLEEVGLVPSTPFVVEIVTPPNANARVMNTAIETTGTGTIAVVMDVYPNPANEQFTITHNLNLANGTVVLTVYDIMGKIMVQQTLKENSELIDVKNLKAGVYFYNLTQNNQTLKTAKLMVE